MEKSLFNELTLEQKQKLLTLPAELKHFTQTQWAHRAEMQRTQLNQFCKGTVTRLDTAVLARLCCALNCKIEDLLEYVPPENKEK